MFDLCVRLLCSNCVRSREGRVVGRGGLSLGANAEGARSAEHQPPFPERVGRRAMCLRMRTLLTGPSVLKNAVSSACCRPEEKPKPTGKIW